MNIRRLLLIPLLLVVHELQAQQPQPNPANKDKVTLSMPSAQMADVVDLYQELTGKRVIRDPKLEEATITIDTRGEMSREEAVDFMEKSLVLAGYCFVPSGDNMVKLLATAQSRIPSTEGVPMILRESELPPGDQVVSHVLRLQHLKAEDAAQAFVQIIPPHNYGKIAAVPNTRSLIITENASTIRAYLELARQVDLPPGEMRHQSIHLQRADAKDVAEQLGVLLGLSAQGNASAQSKTTAVQPTAALNGAQPKNAQEAAAVSAAQVESYTTTPTDTTEAAPPRIQAIVRTNSLLVVARPLDIEYILKLVEELDAESPTKGIVSRQLHYIDLTTFINIAGKALLRNRPDAATTLISPQTSGASGNQSSMNMGGSMNGGGGAYSGGSTVGNRGGATGAGGFSMQGMGNNGQLDITRRADSVLIGRTLVIVDPASSKFFASGPPDELRMLQQLADELDVRPRQIFLSVIIGEFTLGNDFNFGLDWVRTLDRVGANSNNLVGGVLNTQGTTFTDISQLGGASDFIPALSGLTVYGQIGDHLNVFLHTLEQSRRFQVLQKPTVTTLNHQSASIFIGQDIAIPGETLSTAGTVNETTSIRSTTQYIPVRLQLNITPHIYNNSEVMLEFQQLNNDISGYTTISGNQVPNISTQGLQNILIIPDRTTAMLGGLISERDRNNKSGLPVLVRIPVIKHLFGNTNKAKERRELIIFVQPTILPDGYTHHKAQSTWGDNSISYDASQRFGGTPRDGDQLDASLFMPRPPASEKSAPSPKSPRLKRSRVR